MMGKIVKFPKKKKSKKNSLEQIFTVKVYTEIEDNRELFRYEFLGDGNLLGSGLVLDALTYLIPDLIGYCTDPYVVQECIETLAIQLEAKRGK